MFKFNDTGHTIVLGRTQTGKTYATNKILLNQKKGVLFFNVQLEDLKNYITVNRNIPFQKIIDLLKKGHKLNYLPISRLEMSSQEITHIINKLFEVGGFSKKHNIFIVIDEVHLFKKTSQQTIERIATSGIRFGLNGIFLSQRPAEMSNTLMTQSIEMLIFKCNMESQYFKNYDIPILEILQSIENNGEYSFCSYDFEKYVSYSKI
jgi:DNA helicase HerA-like ATPase